MSLSKRVSAIESDIASIKTTIVSVRLDIAGLRNGVTYGIKSRHAIPEQKTDFTELRRNLGDLRANISNQADLLEFKISITKWWLITMVAAPFLRAGLENIGW